MSTKFDGYNNAVRTLTDAMGKIRVQDLWGNDRIAPAVFVDLSGAEYGTVLSLPNSILSRINEDNAAEVNKAIEEMWDKLVSITGAKLERVK